LFISPVRRNPESSSVISQIQEKKEQTHDALLDIAEAGLTEERVGLQRFGMVIVVIAAIAPLLGLLGTVTGMISTFEIITEHGTGDPRMLSGGISEALITTQMGLVVAIPMLLLGNMLNGWSDRIYSKLESTVLQQIAQKG
jgi:biopolymer transport protein ExbB